MSDRNAVLAFLLGELDWSHGQLAEKINVIMGEGYVSRSAVGEWVNRGRIPHEPLPTVVAQLLSNVCGEYISVAGLWRSQICGSATWVTADTGVVSRWHSLSTHETASDWLAYSSNDTDLDSRTFTAVSEEAITALAWRYVEKMRKTKKPLPHTLTKGSGVYVTPGMVKVLAGVVYSLRRLDDQEGGGRETLEFVHRYFCSIAYYLVHGDFADIATRQKLLNLWGEIAQIAGWLAFDSGWHGLAQRYLYTGIDAAQTLKDRNLGAHIMGYLTYQIACRRNGFQGTGLANAAIEVAAGAHPAVRALVHSRFALAQTTVGSVIAYRRALLDAYSLLEEAEETTDRPHWLYWFDKTTLDTQTSCGLLSLPSSVSPGRATRILNECEQLLNPQLNERINTFPRDTLFGGLSLAVGHARAGDIDRAVELGNWGLKLIPKVRSPRVRQLFRDIESALHARQGTTRSREVVDYCTTARQVLGETFFQL